MLRSIRSIRDGVHPLFPYSVFPHLDHRYQAAPELTGFATLSDLQGIVSVNNIPCKFQRSHQQHQMFLQQNLKHFYLQPRANEAGGRYGRGVITRKYRKGQSIKVPLRIYPDKKQERED